MPGLPPPQPSIEIVLYSQGMTKGLRQSEGPQLLIHPELALGPVFVGGYLKNVTSTSADAEAGILAGLRHRVGGFDLVASAAYEWNTGSPTGYDNDRIELNGTISRRLGRVTPRLSVTWSPDDFGTTRRSIFVEAGAAMSLLRGISVSAYVGRRGREGAPDYTAFNAGASYTFSRNLSVDLRYYDTSESRLGVIYASRVVASARAHF